ncbi:hypothetical protein EDC01DRAFT_635049 [Geopyxis carbonaria]|nr:hypothetical protein EDC01DRAFT_635049 [Geopyxis carbonaria]
MTSSSNYPQGHLLNMPLDLKYSTALMLDPIHGVRDLHSWALTDPGLLVVLYEKGLAIVNHYSAPHLFPQGRSQSSASMHRMLKEANRDWHAYYFRVHSAREAALKTGGLEVFIEKMRGFKFRKLSSERNWVLRKWCRGRLVWLRELSETVWYMVCSSTMLTSLAWLLPWIFLGMWYYL